MPPGTAIAVGIGIGAALGAAFSDLATWIAIGVVIGAAIEVGNYFKKYRGGRQKPDATKEVVMRQESADLPKSAIGSGSPRKFSSAPGQVNTHFGDETHEVVDPKELTGKGIDAQMKNTDPDDD